MFLDIPIPTWTDIAVLGAMGMSSFCAYQVYSLLQKEQQKEIPRPIIINTIYVSMVFAFVMIILTLWIEKDRFSRDQEVANINIKQFTNQLETIKKENYFSSDSLGQPKKIELSFNDTIYPLSNSIIPKGLRKKIIRGKGPLNILIDKDKNYQIQDSVDFLGVLSKPKLEEVGFFTGIRQAESNNKSKSIFTKDSLNGLWKEIVAFKDSSFKPIVKDIRSVGTIYEIIRNNNSNEEMFSSINDPGIIDSLQRRPIHFVKGESSYYMIYLSSVRNKKPYRFEFTKIKLDPYVQ